MPARTAQRKPRAPPPSPKAKRKTLLLCPEALFFLAGPASFGPCSRELSRPRKPRRTFFCSLTLILSTRRIVVATLVSIAHAGPYDMASFMVKLHCQSVAEKLLIPAFVYFFFKLYPPAWISNPRRSEAGAAGGCILIRPAALEKAGGIAAIRQEVIDDCSLAKRVKHNGGRLWLGASATTRSIRPYEGFAGIGRMISRSAFNQLRHSNLLLLLSMAGMAATYLLPLALVLRHIASCLPLWAARHGCSWSSAIGLCCAFTASIRCGRWLCPWRQSSIWELRSIQPGNIGWVAAANGKAGFKILKRAHKLDPQI